MHISHWLIIESERSVRLHTCWQTDMLKGMDRGMLEICHGVFSGIYTPPLALFITKDTSRLHTRKKSIKPAETHGIFFKP